MDLEGRALPIGLLDDDLTIDEYAQKGDMAGKDAQLTLKGAGADHGCFTREDSLLGCHNFDSEGH